MNFLIVFVSRLKVTVMKETMTQTDKVITHFFMIFILWYVTWLNWNIEFYRNSTAFCKCQFLNDFQLYYGDNFSILLSTVKWICRPTLLKSLRVCKNNFPWTISSVSFTWTKINGRDNGIKFCYSLLNYKICDKWG